jgi:hypothetical protein
VSPNHIHAIKLKGPWSIIRRPGDTTSTPYSAPESVHLPVDWRSLFGHVAGTAVFERRFNRPTGLTEEHRVRIVLRDVAGLHQVALNDAPLPIENGADGSQIVEITRRMESHNRLTIELQFDPVRQPELRGGLWQPVILEIEAPEKAVP